MGAGATSSESEEEVKVDLQATAGFRKANARSSQPLSKGVGKWEQYTRGIGAKLLLQMGYEPGKGLGKDLQGISNPVQAAVRKGRGAIGAYGPEVHSSVDDKPKRRIDEDEKEAQEFKEKLHQWRKGDEPVSKGKKQRYYYRSVEDIIEKGKKRTAFSDNLRKKLGNVTVIDMTGPEKRVLSGYHALGQTKVIDETLYDHQPTKKSSNFALPELMHNLNLIVDMCEQEIIAIDKTKRSANDRETAIKQETEKLNKIVELEQNHIRTLEDVEELVDALVNPKDLLTLDSAEKLFVRLKTDYPGEYKEFGLGDLAPGIIAPMISDKLKDWNPLEDPTNYVGVIKRWRGILGDPNQSQQKNVFDPFSALIWSGIIPSIRLAANIWDPRNHQPMAALLDTWAPLLPSYILDNVLEQIILPRLNVCVKNWDPLTDTIPIHVWIHPWVSLLKHKMEDSIFVVIREKLGNALTAWSPSDRSARVMLTPWKNVFSDGDMQSFLVKHIIPKLQLSIAELIINPMQQDLECWNQVSEWNELISTVHMTQLLDKCFFPKWIQTLVIWLNQNPNLDQVSRWYTGWKTLIPDDILQQTVIKEHFRRALELMHRSTGLQTASVDRVPSPPPPPKLMDLQIPPPTMEFKDLVLQKCSERGIIFVPMPGRKESGKQVYRVGKLFCYIDRSVIMISDGNLCDWSPISLVSLLERC